MESNRPLTESDLIFPTAAQPSLSNTLSSLKRSALSTHNRLSSITHDSEFITSVAEAYDLPLIANERCGSWYIPPESKKESVYFKSTDGHMGQWGFSCRRVNLQLLEVLGENGGGVIVDSTRRGKSMPDALSKTVPIWCCVLNRAIFGSEHALYTPPQAVSESEHSQIASRIPGFVQQFLEICKPDLELLRAQIKRPMRPIWVTHESSLPGAPPVFDNFVPVVLCTASRRVRGAEGSEGGYIQGAADDHEAWAGGLTPTIFWKNKAKLLGTNEEELPGLIAKLVKDEKRADAVPICVKPTSSLHVSTMQNVDLSPFDIIISCGPSPLTTASHSHAKSKNYLHLQCQNGKLGSRDLRQQLAYLEHFFSNFSSSSSSKEPLGNILICCPTGKDLSVGVALAILCLYTDNTGTITPEKRKKKIDKTFIKQRLAWLTTTSPTLNPPRGTLQSVNAVLMPGFSNTTDESPSSIPAEQLCLQLVDAEGMPISPSTSTPETHTAPAPASVEPVEGQNSTSAPSLSTSSFPSKIFASLLTEPKAPWTFTRTLTSKLPSHPSGTVTGTASFTPYSTNPSTTSPNTLLYAEEGEFTTTIGLRFTARRKYIYQLENAQTIPDVNKLSLDNGATTAEQDQKGQEPYIAVYFHDDATTSSSSSAKNTFGGLFVEMGRLTSCSPALSGSTAAEPSLMALNKETHLCAEDLYTALWKFGGGMVSDGAREGKDTWWEVRYDVKGPKKDYVSETRYTKVDASGMS